MSANCSWSSAPSWIAKWFGNTVRPRTSTDRLSSSSRTSRRPSSTGRSPLRNARANTPSTIRSKRRSKPFRPTGRHCTRGVLHPLPGALTWRLHSGEWRNRQTRWLQVPVSERTWGFKSPLAHHHHHHSLRWEIPHFAISDRRREVGADQPDRGEKVALAGAAVHERDALGRLLLDEG